MPDNLRDRIAAAIINGCPDHITAGAARAAAGAVIAALQPELDRHNTGCVCNDCWRDQPSYADNFCRGGCDCSCCYGMADEPCHCRDAVCNCGGDRAAHGQKPLEVK